MVGRVGLNAPQDQPITPSNHAAEVGGQPPQAANKEQPLDLAASRITGVPPLKHLADFFRNRRDAGAP